MFDLFLDLREEQEQGTGPRRHPEGAAAQLRPPGAERFRGGEETATHPTQPTQTRNCQGLGDDGSCRPSRVKKLILLFLFYF